MLRRNKKYYLINIAASQMVLVKIALNHMILENIITIGRNLKKKKL